MDIAPPPEEHPANRDPFQLELFEAVKKRRSKELSISDPPEDDADDHFDADLNRKMSKLSLPRTFQNKIYSDHKPEHEFRSGENEDESEENGRYSKKAQSKKQNDNFLIEQSLKEPSSIFSGTTKGAPTTSPRPKPRRDANSSQENHPNVEPESMRRPVPSPRLGAQKEGNALQAKFKGQPDGLTAEGPNIDVKVSSRSPELRSGSLPPEKVSSHELEKPLILKDAHEVKMSRNARPSRTPSKQEAHDAEDSASRHSTSRTAASYGLPFGIEKFDGGRSAIAVTDDALSTNRESYYPASLSDFSSSKHEGSESPTNTKSRLSSLGKPMVVESLKDASPRDESRFRGLPQRPADHLDHKEDGASLSKKNIRDLKADISPRTKSPLDIPESVIVSMPTRENPSVEKSRSRSKDPEPEYASDNHKSRVSKQNSDKASNRSLDQQTPLRNGFDHMNGGISLAGREIDSTLTRETYTAKHGQGRISPSDKHAVTKVAVDGKGAHSVSGGKLTSKLIGEEAYSDFGGKASDGTTLESHRSLRTPRDHVRDSEGELGKTYSRGKDFDEPRSKLGPSKEIDDLFNSGLKQAPGAKTQSDRGNKALKEEDQKAPKIRPQLSSSKDTKKSRLTNELSATMPSKKSGPVKADLALTGLGQTGVREELKRQPLRGASPVVTPRSRNNSKSNPLSETPTVSRPLSATKRSQSFTNISNIRPTPPRPISPDSETGEPNELDSSKLREQIYFDWLQSKSSFVKEKKLEIKKEEEQSAMKLQEKLEREALAKKTYDSWMEKKSEVLQSQMEKNKSERAKSKEKEDEKLQRKLDAKRFYESWKEKKDELLKAQSENKRSEIRKSKRREQEEKTERVDISKKVYEKWKAQKDEQIKEKILEKKKQQDEEKENELDKMEKRQLAQRLFQDWKEQKAASARPSTPSLTQRPWCPNGRYGSNSNIPEVVQPVIVRNAPGRKQRTLSASARLTSNVR